MKMTTQTKFNIDRLDWEYIVQTINSSLLDDYSKTQIHSLLKQGIQISDMALDYLLIAIKHNNELAPSYKRHLINLVKEMNSGLYE